MKCKETRSLLRQLLEGDLPVLLVQELEAHFFECEDCARFYLDSFASGISTGMPDTSSLLAAVILETSGTACSGIRSELLNLADGVCDDSRAVLLKQHLEGCEDCSSLLETLIALKSELPELLECETEPRFTDEVLRETSKRFKPARSLGARLQEHLSAAWRRPRFPLEAAYAGSLVLALILFVTPFMTVQDLAARPLRLIEVEVRDSLDSTRQLVRTEFRHRSKRAEGRVAEIQQEWDQRFRSWSLALDDNRKSLAERWQTVLDAKDQQAARVSAWWHGLVGDFGEGTSSNRESTGPVS